MGNQEIREKTEDSLEEVVKCRAVGQWHGKQSFSRGEKVAGARRGRIEVSEIRNHTPPREKAEKP